MTVGQVKEDPDVVAIRLRQMRRVRSWTQEELADRAGVTQSQVSAWEGGRRSPDIESVRKLAQAFDMSHEELAKEIGYIDPPPDPLPHGDIFSRFPIARLDEELRKLPVGPGQPTYGDEMRQLERLQPPARERMIRVLARDFLHALRRELEREEQEAAARVEETT